MEPMKGLFADDQKIPLAERLRPRSLDEFSGQPHLVGPNGVLRSLIESKQVRSLILWGPPGVGKTTLGMIMARDFGSHFVQFSATRSGIKEVQAAMESSKQSFQTQGRRDLIFVDEIHRYNRAQQDAFLPYLEEGSVIVVGATTENPSFRLRSALLSRSQVFVLKPLTDDDLIAIIDFALNDERGLGNRELSLDADAQGFLIQYADGDARKILNGLELASDLCQDQVITLELIQQALQQKSVKYDQSGEEHYDIISALHKSVRNSDPDAALYWLARMLAGGEDPLYIARRLIRMATEDIGLAAPNALLITIAAWQAHERMGSPEADLALAEATVYLATAPKSNAVYAAFDQAKRDVEQTRNDPVPLQLRNAVTGLMKNLDYGKDYQYAHDHENAVTDMQCLPDNLKDRTYYTPTEYGLEAELKKRLSAWRQRPSNPKKDQNI
jgi:putative ATPase